MAIDWLGMLGQGLNYAQIRGGFDDARNNLQEGFGDARRDLRSTQEPYSQFGLDSMQNYQDMGDFSFDPNDFYDDPSYQLRQKEQMNSIMSNQAVNKMLGSTGTLDTMMQRSGELAGQEYQAAFDRAKDTYGMNLDRNKFGVQTGADVAMNLGNNLADVGIGEGAALASMNASEARLLSNVISSTLASMGQPSDPNTVSGMINDAISSGVGSVGDFLQDKLGGMVGDVAQGGLSALGIGGAVAGDTMLGTAAGNTAMQWGVGGLDAALGGTTGATAASFGGGTTGAEIAAAQQAGASAAATTGFASWASTAAIGIGALFAFRAFVDGVLKSGDSKWTSAMEDLKNSTNPLGDIQKLSADDLPRIASRSEDNWNQLSDRAARGALYGTILKDMPPEQVQGLRMHEDIGSIANDMYQFAISGQTSGGKHSLGGDPTAALKALFPEMGGQIDQMFRSATQKSTEYELDVTSDPHSTDYFRMAMQPQRDATIARGETAQREFKTYMDRKLRQWQTERTAASAMEVFA